MFARRNKSAFTLVEILIVVIILGILAAIVIPQFTNASQDARKSSLLSQVQTLRSQIELFRLEHQGKYPTSTGLVDGVFSWDLLTHRSLEVDPADPAAAPAVDDANGTKGPYLQAEMTNPLTQGSNWATAPAVGVAYVMDSLGHIYGLDLNGAIVSE